MEAAKVYSRTEHAMTPDVLFISKRIWDKLKPEQQNSCARPRAPRLPVQRQAWDAQEAESLEAAKAAGAQLDGRGQGGLPPGGRAGGREVREHARPAAPSSRRFEDTK